MQGHPPPLTLYSSPRQKSKRPRPPSHSPPRPPRGADRARGSEDASVSAAAANATWKSQQVSSGSRAAVSAETQAAAAAARRFAAAAAMRRPTTEAQLQRLEEETERAEEAVMAEELAAARNRRLQEYCRMFPRLDEGLSSVFATCETIEQADNLYKCMRRHFERGKPAHFSIL